MNTVKSDTQAKSDLGFFVAEFEEQFAAAFENKLIARPAREIHALWVELGRPDEPTEGPYTSVHGHVMTWIEADEFPDATGEEAEQWAIDYNRAQRDLLELTGIWYVGGESWHTHRTKGSDAWEKFTEDAAEIANDWINYRLWDVFCASLPEEQ